MACLPLVRCHLVTVCTSLTRNFRTFSAASLCHTHHSLCRLTKPLQAACLLHQGKRKYNFPACYQHCQGYHTGVQCEALENVPQLDLDSEESIPIETQETVDASEVLQNLSPQDIKKLKMIKLEYDVVGEMGGRVPENMTDENWLHVLRLDSKSQRMNYYRFLTKKENMQKSKQEKKVKRQQQKQQSEAATEGEEQGQRFDKNTIFMMVRESTMLKVANGRLARAMLFGQPLVFDMGYEQYMRPQDCQNVVDQLIDTYSKNRSHMNPFHMVFTSLSPSGLILPKLKKQFLSGQHFFGTMTDKSYLDLFPPERLVYLSPHAREELKEVNYHDVYIVGAFVDKACQKPVSLARAKEQGIHVAKFPLDRYLLWGDGSKSLTLDQVIGILLEQRESNDWEKALQAIPRRKLKRNDL